MTPSTKISRIETFLAPPRRLFVRVETDEGVVGWGEPVVEGRAEPVRAAVPLLADCAPLFAEEPVLPSTPHALPLLVAASTIPLALGECLSTRREFPAPLRAGVAVVQPDVSHAGGISELRRIAALAETYGALLAPHCPLGPVALAASLQVVFTTPNFLIQEQSPGPHHHRGAELLDYVADPAPFLFDRGALLRTDRPGLGVDVDEAAVRAADAAGGHTWRNPVRRYDDGAFAEW
ncbi:hypothetical protein MUU72_27165 [Streptomyces sp. RS10V-4]|nr:enolase C-terminal domain-like protein [Streptomyces rhizoryzae]MCK7626740.1 hypothetical protein [Streptomyces rhizoryzae]